MATLLLTGAQGFTGRHLHEAATRAGHAVRSLEADLTDAAAVERELRAVAPAALVHLAGIAAVTHERVDEIYRVNLIGTLNLLVALAGLPEPPSRVVLASSANVYGNAPQSPIDEAMPLAPQNHYAVSKAAMEQMSALFAAQLPIVVARPFNYTGPGHDERFLIPKLVAHFASRAPFVELGNLDVEREFNDVRMVCDAYLKLIELGAPGETYNVCSGRPVTLRSVVAALERITGHRIEVRVNPAFVRANEVRTLCGNPAKLESRIGPLSARPLEEMLRWMLANA